MKKLFILLVFAFTLLGCKHNPMDLSTKEVPAEKIIQSQDYVIQDSTSYLFILQGGGYDYVFERAEEKTILIAHYNTGSKDAMALTLFIGLAVGILLSALIAYRTE